LEKNYFRDDTYQRTKNGLNVNTELLDDCYLNIFSLRHTWSWV